MGVSALSVVLSKFASHRIMQFVFVCVVIVVVVLRVVFVEKIFPHATDITLRDNYLVVPS